MKKKIKFSVLMSVYTKEKPENLSMAIESILSQSLLPDEFIIVKDGPLTKELNDCINKFVKKSRIIKIIELKNNVGLGNALNEGLKHCSHDYIARMDSDDISFSDRFEKQINYLENNEDCDLVGGNIIEFDDATNNDISSRNVPNDPEKILKYFKKRNPVNHVTVIFKKNSVVEAGSYQDCPYFEDYYLWARMIKLNKKIVNLNENMVRVRAGLNMSSRRGNFKYIGHIINFEKKLYNLNLINFFEFVYNILSRSAVALLPNKIRYMIYQKKLRTK